MIEILSGKSGCGLGALEEVLLAQHPLEHRSSGWSIREVHLLRPLAHECLEALERAPSGGLVGLHGPSSLRVFLLLRALTPCRTRRGGGTTVQSRCVPSVRDR